MSRKLRHFLSADDIDPGLALRVFTRARELWAIDDSGHSLPQTLVNRRMAAFFYRESTRTRFASSQAMQMLGGTVVTTDDPRTSSVVKGETVEATAQALEDLRFHVIALRHDQMGAAAQMAQALSRTIVINCGDGSNEHPTQALGDLFVLDDLIREVPALRERLGVALIGDCANARTIRSNLRLLTRFAPSFAQPEFFAISPPCLRLRDDIRGEIAASGIRLYEAEILTPEIARRCAVFYLSRTQDERWEGEPLPQEFIDGSAFAPTPELVDAMPPYARIMHPQPYRLEIPAWLHGNPRAYWRAQVTAGLFARAALLEELLLH